MQGLITNWMPAAQQGRVTDPTGTHTFRWTDCSPSLQFALEDIAIPPGRPIQVIYQLTPAGEAISLDLSGDDPTPVKGG
jgi:hypothetical protein